MNNGIRISNKLQIKLNSLTAVYSTLVFNSIFDIPIKANKVKENAIIVLIPDAKSILKL